MKKWSRQIALTTLIACVSIVAPNWAKAKDYDPCDPCGGWAPCSFGELEVGGEFLWWKPSVDHLEYAHVEKPLGNGRTKSTVKALCPDWEPGGRVWIHKPSLLCGACGIGASLTGIHMNHSETFVGTVTEGNNTKFFGNITLPSAAYYYGNYKFYVHKLINYKPQIQV